jgi:hypothetical protein
MLNTFSDKIIVVAIIILVLLFFKGFGYLLYLSIFELGLYDDNKETENTMEKIYNFLDKYLLYASDLLDTILLLVACYILFFRKHNSIFTIGFCFMLILKFILHFLLLNRFGIKTNLNKKKNKLLFKFKSINSFASNTFAFIIAGYMLHKIF